MHQWEKAHQWYDRLVGDEGHFYHQHLIWPNLKKWLPEEGRLVDFACGQGVLGRTLPTTLHYTGIDASSSLITTAKKRGHGAFYIADVTKPLPFKETFDIGTCLLALQNFEDRAGFFRNARALLKPAAPLILVINHPCFRIPRQSSWGIDESKKTQYRRIDRYMTALDIPIHVNTKEPLVHHHFPLSALNAEGFVITAIEEWCSPKTSEGSKKKMEDRARQEFPLFMCLVLK